jgi:hypothetical protein
MHRLLVLSDQMRQQQHAKQSTSRNTKLIDEAILDDGVIYLL